LEAKFTISADPKLSYLPKTRRETSDVPCQATS